MYVGREKSDLWDLVLDADYVGTKIDTYWWARSILEHVCVCVFCAFVKMKTSVFLLPLTAEELKDVIKVATHVILTFLSFLDDHGNLADTAIALI